MAWSTAKKIAVGIGAVAFWEGAWWARRRALRGATCDCALAEAKALKKPLVVVGAPDAGVTAGYGCGDITIDAGSSSCPRFMQADITKKIPLADNSAVVFVSCVLEYVDDYPAAMKELRRVAGSHLYVVRVEPWTLAGWLYPGAKRQLSAAQAPSCQRPALPAAS